MTHKPYTPTRTCPHRWCKPLHMAPLPFVLAFVAFELWNNWRILLVIACGIIAGIWLPKMLHYKATPRSRPATVREVVADLRQSPSPIDLEMQDAKYAGTGWRTLQVRKGWARIAVGCDLLILAAVGISCTAIFTAPTQAARSAASGRVDASMIVSIVVGIAFFGFNLYAHKKATQPRKPKRVTVPSALQTNT